MAKTKAQKRKNESKEGPLKRIKTVPLTPPSDDVDTPKSLPSITLGAIGLATEDLELAVDTLTTLSRNPSVIKSKQCKDLRTAVYEFRTACTTGFNATGARASTDSNSNLTARISGALADGGYIEARILLAEMRIRGQKPKLGALCRWVRDLDVVSGLAEQIQGEKRGEKEGELLGVLDAVLRVLGEVDYSAITDAENGPLNVRPVWNLRERGMERRRVYDAVLDGSIFGCVEKDIKSRFRTIETTPGPARKPPNHHPAILWASSDDAILLEPQETKAMAYKHEIVPNLHLLKDVLSSRECEQIIAAAESIGFTPDAPIRAEGEEISVLAHNFYWIVDTAFCSKLWDRVAHMVPAQVGGKKVRGINRRFRVYRYVPGAEYRAHIDGAWPPSGIDPVTDTYIYDFSPPGLKQSSLFTFLIYLNDEFEGGETTYFLPSAKEGTMNAYSIRPVQGSVAMFPHGETEGSLLHEGTGVRAGGGKSAKYVIRTDVLYDVGT